MSNYKHKNITFPEEINNNYFLVNAKNNLSRLIKIHDMEIPYIPSDYPTLINTFEQLYKGTCQELLKLHPDSCYKKTDSDYAVGHRFVAFMRTIDDYIPISETKEGYDIVIDTGKRLESLYNSTRYENHIPFEDFQKDYRRLEAQVNRLMNGLQKEYSKCLITEEEDEELKLY